jgi:hypothetical protein
MGTGRRAYNLLRAYVGREWDRIKQWERTDALKELGQGIDPEPGTPEARARQEERDPDKTVVYIPEGSTREQAAAHILGVKEGAGFAEVRLAFVKLSRRSNPENFPKDTPECDQARDIYRKVHWAYKILTEKVSDSEKRFGSLEID